MDSRPDWRRSIGAMVRKEALCELRSPHGLLTGGLFGLLAVVAVGLAAFNVRVPATLAAGLVWVVLLFGGVAALPRVFVGEEERGTGDLLRLTCDPHTVYWGKSIYTLLSCLASAFVFGGLAAVALNRVPADLGLFVASLAAGALALSGAVTLCGALAARAANRQALAGAIALPLAIPVAVWGVASLRVAFGDGFFEAGRSAAIGLAAYGVTSNAVGPFIYAALWKS